MWYKQGHTQQDFDQDTLECRIIAEQLANEKSISRQPNLLLLAQYHQECLQRRGWTPDKPPEKVAAGSEKAFPTVTLDGRSVSAFGVTFQIPEGFELIESKDIDEAVAVRRTVLWGRNGEEYLHLGVQQAVSVEFQKVAYPFQPNSDTLYDQRLAEPGKHAWRSFMRIFNGEPIGICGTIWRIDDERRLIFTASTALPEEPPGPVSDLRISEAQHRVMAAFTDRWAAWFDQGLPAPSLGLRRFLAPIKLLGR